MGKMILIIDDEPKNVKLARDILQAEGFSTMEAANGKEGVGKAKSEKPDLILMDIKMPVMDGFQAIKALKSDNDVKGIQVVALTASAMKGDKEKILEAGFNGYLSKPIDIDEFVGTVNKFLSR